MKMNPASALVAVFLASGVLADPIEGTWQTEPDDGAYAHVKITPCGEEFCGIIESTFREGSAYTSPNIGKQLVIDMAPQGSGRYEGKVWRPSNDKIYLGKIALSGDAMKLSGCVAGGLICSKQTWQRVK